MTSTQDSAKTDSGTTDRAYATVNPFTGETEREFDSLPSDQVTAVVDRAHTAYLDWRGRSVAERAAVVGRAADLMLERTDAFAALITKEMGKRIQEAAGEVQLAASILRYYADSKQSQKAA